MSFITKESEDKLNTLRESGEWCCIDISSDFGYRWSIKLTHERSPMHMVSVRSGKFENLDDAIAEIYKWADDFLSSMEARVE